jgi:hypothetical protein
MSSGQHKIAAGTKILPIQKNTAKEKHFCTRIRRRKKEKKPIFTTALDV